MADNPQPKTAPQPDPWERLRAPFAPEEIEKLPKQLRRNDENKARCEAGSFASADGHYCGGWHPRSVHLDYVGHAGVTMRLNEVDPKWSWTPMHVELLPWVERLVERAAEAGDHARVDELIREHGAPLTRDGGMWIRLTVLGVTRTGFGDSQGKTGPNATKEIIGDALRNAAMRFGVGTYLWSKSSAAAVLRHGGELDADEPQQQPERPRREKRAKPVEDEWTMPDPEKVEEWRTAAMVAPELHPKGTERDAYLKAIWTEIVESVGGSNLPRVIVRVPDSWSRYAQQPDVGMDVFLLTIARNAAMPGADAVDEEGETGEE